MIKFTLSETPEQAIINKLADCKRARINETITAAVIFFRGKHRHYKINEIYGIVGSHCGLSTHRVRQIYSQAPKTSA